VGQHCSKLVVQREKATLQWLQDQTEINWDNLNNVRHVASIHFRSKRREYLKDKINELAMNCKNKNIRDMYRGINQFKRGYHPRSNFVKDKNSDLLADSKNIFKQVEIMFLSGAVYALHQ
jgi:hypothetical protein